MALEERIDSDLARGRGRLVPELEVLTRSTRSASASRRSACSRSTARAARPTRSRSCGRRAGGSTTSSGSRRPAPARARAADPRPGSPARRAPAHGRRGAAPPPPPRGASSSPRPSSPPPRWSPRFTHGDDTVGAAAGARTDRAVAIDPDIVDGAGNRYGVRTVDWHDRQARDVGWREAGGCPADPVDDMDGAVRQTDHRDAVTADGALMRVDDSQHTCRSESGVDGVAALLECVLRCPGRAVVGRRPPTRMEWSSESAACRELLIATGDHDEDVVDVSAHLARSRFRIALLDSLEDEPMCCQRGTNAVLGLERDAS